MNGGSRFVAFSLTVQLGILFWRKSHVGVEGADKVGIGLEAGALAGFLYIGPLPQQLLRRDDAELDDIFHHTEAGSLFKNMAQVVLAQHEALRQVVQRNFLCAVSAEIFQYRLNTVVILIGCSVFFSCGAGAAADQKQNLIQGHPFQNIGTEGGRKDDAELFKQTGKLCRVLVRQTDAGPGLAERFEEIGARGGELLQERGKQVKNIAAEDGTVGTVFVAVQRVGIQDKERVFAEGIHLPIHKKIAAVTEDKHELNPLVIVETVHAPFVILLILNDIIV